MLRRVRRVARGDVIVAAAFVAAAAVEAVVRHRAAPGPLALNVTGALWLGSLALRRHKPVVPLGVICGAAVFGTVLSQLWWPDAPDGGGVWLFAVMLASYSLGAHTRGPVVALGVLLPLVLALVADLPTASGWPLVSGVVFITIFIGLVPAAVGRLVRTRHDRLLMLRDQRDLIARSLQTQQESAVFAERLRTNERLQPTLLHGLRALAEKAEDGAPAAVVEAEARRLLERTRHEVTALTAPIDELLPPEVPSADHVLALRASAQPWATMVACAVAAGLAVESTHVLALTAPAWVAVALSVVVAAPVGLCWWRPVSAAAAAFVTATVFSRLVAPLDGSLSETGLALATAFAVGALSRRRTAVLGLLVCVAGQVVGVGTDDPLGEAEILVMCWLGGVALHEVSRLVEQTRANNELLAGQEAVALRHAVVEERLRFARELHDAIGSNLTVIALQAGGARRLAERSADRAGQVMRDVAAVARDGLAALEPSSADGDLAGLLERVRSAGLDVDARLDDLSALAPATRFAVHRVLQEALTNVLRHAPGSHAALSLTVRDEVVELRVTNSAGSGPGSTPVSRLGSTASTGRGLAGIRERVAACEGEVSFGPLANGGFELSAVVPRDRVSEAVS
jgi:signal transduction histidine kinase